MKRPWDQVKLRVLEHQELQTEHPVEGDELHTSRGRRYLVTNYTEKQITALVLPTNEPLTEQRVWRWTWGVKAKA